MTYVSIYDYATVRTPRPAAPTPPQDRAGMEKLRSIMKTGLSLEEAYAQCLASSHSKPVPRATYDEAKAVILAYLAQGPAAASDIVDATGLLQPMVSTCLKSMNAKGFIRALAPRMGNERPAVWGIP